MLKRRPFMQLSEVVAAKIKKICEKKKISLNKMSKICHLRQSTLQSLIDGKSKNPKLQTIKTICDGLEISFQDFFEDELFSKVESEEKIENI